MRKNKKLLLASVAAMGALALGVGATSTFAWYAATAGATTTIADTTQSITLLNPGSVDDQVLTLVATITAEENVELSNTTGETWYVVGGRTIQKTTPNNVGSWSVSFDWASNADKAVFLGTSPANDYVFDCTVTALNQVKLLNAGTAPVDANIIAKQRVTVTVDKDDGTISAATNTGYFAVRATDQTTGDGKEAEATSGHNSDQLKIVAGYTA